MKLSFLFIEFHNSVSARSRPRKLQSSTAETKTQPALTRERNVTYDIIERFQIYNIRNVPPFRGGERGTARVIASGFLVLVMFCIKQRWRHLKTMPLASFRSIGLCLGYDVRSVCFGFSLVRFVAPAMMDATNCCRMFIIVTWISSSFPVPVAAASTVRGGVKTHTHTHSHLCPDSHALTHTHTHSLHCALSSQLEHFIYGILSLRDRSRAHIGISSRMCPASGSVMFGHPTKATLTPATLTATAKRTSTATATATPTARSATCLSFCFVSHSAARLNVPLFPSPPPPSFISCLLCVSLFTLRCPFHGMYSYVGRDW